ncbi:hypothetical protein AB6A40_007320 [Gnathostoma spinigerum]|uniref:Uncharacterized protein n=1 Tax=Gnathostoma spinigerum TaxID=75299 RepID=A0ABD6EMV6_9BILA
MKARQHRYPIWKLSLDVATFGIFYLFHVVFIIFSLLQDDCFFLANLMEMRQAFGIIRCGLLLRILADQLIIVAINWFFSNHSQPLPNTISLFGIPSSGKNDKIGRLIRENCETKPKEEATLLAVGP